MLPSSTLLYTLTLLLRLTHALDVDFSAYPSASRSCLKDEADASGCMGETVSEMNLCLCGNSGNFVLDTASCVGALGKDVVTDVYQVMETSCSETKTPLDISEVEFFAASNTTTEEPAASTSDASSSDDDNDDDDDDDDDSDDNVLFTAKIGLVMAIIVAVLMVVCIICLIVLIKKRRRDKALLREAQEVAARAVNGERGSRDRYDKPLLEPGAMTPGFQSPAGTGGSQSGPPFGATVLPPTPSYPGPAPSPQVWRSGTQAGQPLDPQSPYYYQQQQQQQEYYNQQQHQQRQELSSDQMPLELDNRALGHLTHWPSPVSQGVGTMGSWCPSPMTATAPSDVLAYYQHQQQHLHNNGGMGTLGAVSQLSSPLSRQITHASTMRTINTQRTSWVHDMPPQEEPYELSGTEIRSPVEADSVPITIRPDRLSLTISAAPPQYERGDWNDPITDKPPI